jgi:hypothetical protein
VYLRDALFRTGWGEGRMTLKGGSVNDEQRMDARLEVYGEVDRQ